MKGATAELWVKINRRPTNAKKIIIAGDSAGGGLVLSVLLRIKQEGLPKPLGAYCLSPFTDLTFTGESRKNNRETDPMLADSGGVWFFKEIYCKDKDTKNPLISHIFADFSELSPILIQVSRSEILFDDAKRVYDRAKSQGVDIELQIWDDMPHVFQFFGLSESAEAIKKFKEFVQKLFS